MAQKYTEAQILAGLKNNDNRICKYIFEEYYIPLLYLAQRLIHNREDAEDIVLQVFHKFWNIRENFASSVSIKAFLNIATRNHCLNFSRDRKRRTERWRKVAADWRSKEQVLEIERLIIESDFLTRVYHEIGKLPEKCRQVFILTYFEGLTSGEIAKKMNVTVSTVTTQRMRAVKFLKNVLSSNDYLLLFWLLTCFYFHG